MKRPDAVVRPVIVMRGGLLPKGTLGSKGKSLSLGQDRPRIGARRHASTQVNFTVRWMFNRRFVTGVSPQTRPDSSCSLQRVVLHGECNSLAIDAMPKFVHKSTEQTVALSVFVLDATSPSCCFVCAPPTLTGTPHVSVKDIMHAPRAARGHPGFHVVLQTPAVQYMFKM